MKGEAELSEKFNSQEEVTIFHKIVNGDIKCDKVYEDDEILAFNDIAPQAPRHIIVIPKKMDGLSSLSKAREDHQAILGKLLYTTSVIAKQEKLDEGYRVVINCDKHGCQSVNYIHIHLLGGRKFGWPPGTGPQDC